MIGPGLSSSKPWIMQAVIRHSTERAPRRGHLDHHHSLSPARNLATSSRRHGSRVERPRHLIQIHPDPVQLPHLRRSQPPLNRAPHPLTQRPAAQVGSHGEARGLGSLPQFCFLGLRHPHADRACPAISPRNSVALAFISPRNAVVEAVRSAFVTDASPLDRMAPTIASACLDSIPAASR